MFYSERLQNAPRSSAAARRIVERLEPQLDPETLANLRLLVSELVTNAVRHACGESFEVRLEVTQDMLRLEVRDDGSGFQPRIQPSDDGTGGYGLYIVERLADRWGVERDAGGVIWVELDRAR